MVPSVGADTEVATAKYMSNSSNRQTRRAELESYQKARAIETRNRFFVQHATTWRHRWPYTSAKVQLSWKDIASVV